MLVGAWRCLPLGLKNECDVAVETKLRTNKDNLTVQHEHSWAILSKVILESLLSCSEVGEGVTKFLLLVLGGVVAFFRLEFLKMTWTFSDEGCEDSE